MTNPEREATVTTGSDEVRPRGRHAIVIASAVVLIVLVVLSGLFGRRARAEHHVYGPADHELVSGDDAAAFSLAPPPFKGEDVFPCSECHEEDVPPNPERRVLDMAHEEIVLQHDEEHRWCLDCHDEENRDKLRLASGALIDFTESYKLCGQCHGAKYREWRAGIHGRRTGHWNGEKQYLLCVSCHWAHAPRFGPLKPMPPPDRPEEIR